MSDVKGRVLDKLSKDQLTNEIENPYFEDCLTNKGLKEARCKWCDSSIKEKCKRGEIIEEPLTVSEIQERAVDLALEETKREYLKKENELLNALVDKTEYITALLKENLTLKKRFLENLKKQIKRRGKESEVGLDD